MVMYEWIGGKKVRNHGPTESTSRSIGHLTLISGPNGVWENIFQLFRFTQQAQNSYLSSIFDDI